MSDQVNGMPLVKHESGATWPVDTDLVYAEGSMKLKLVLYLAWPEAVGRAKPSPNRPGQAKPKCRPADGFGPA